jgi:penicillin amidase
VSLSKNLGARRLTARGAIAVAGVLAIATLSACGWVYWILRASLPILEGRIAGAEISAPVVITRDSQGVPTLRGRTRADLAWAMGYLHAQERFFQMDGQRRVAAGELAELVGTIALPQDRERRKHRFRHRAATVLAAMMPEERRVLDAYVTGVNRGLGDLGTVPFEYWLLRSNPAPWTAEDTVLTAYAMYLDLQEADGATERRRARAEEALGSPLTAFLFPEGTSWDAPLDGSTLPTPELPSGTTAGTRSRATLLDGEIEEASHGSNGWAVSGLLSARGGALVANDMHLSLRIPNVWYRARLVMDGSRGTELDITGFTLPGSPNIVAGSNGKIAWGFTNSYVDTSDVVVLDAVDGDPRIYRTAEGPRSLNDVEERICAKGAVCENFVHEESVWGPVIGSDHKGRKLAYRWVAHDPVAVNLRGILELERADTAWAALEVASKMGIPHQNLVVGDSQGNIGWTVTSALPDRFGFDGRLPTSWADGTKGWRGYLSRDDIPVVFNPDGHRIWTANSRMVGGRALEKLGFGAYAHGSRARQIRDSLLARERFDEEAMLAIQLDDRGVLLERWQELMLGRLRAEPGNPQYLSLAPHVENWGGRAVPDSVGYRLVRTFRSELIRIVYEGFLSAGEGLTWADGGRRRMAVNQADEPIWRLLAERPGHLLPPGHSDWDSVLRAAIESTVSAVAKQADGRLETFTWGLFNRAEIGHPLSRVVPGLSYMLDPPSKPQPGDIYQPRVAAPAFGASERFVVAPSQEATGISHMPGGQSGHPLSPYYLVAHEDWASGRPAPFLPGKPKWELTLHPGAGR